MNKNLIIVLVVIALAVGVYFVMQNNGFGESPFRADFGSGSDCSCDIYKEYETTNNSLGYGFNEFKLGCPGKLVYGEIDNSGCSTNDEGFCFGNCIQPVECFAVGSNLSHGSFNLYGYCVDPPLGDSVLR